MSKKELEQEYISNNIYDDFIKENIEFGESYKCTIYSIQEKFLSSKNIDIKCKLTPDSIRYVELYTLDIKRYIKNKYHKNIEKISIDDIKNSISIASRNGYIGFRMKNLYVDNFFDNRIYTDFFKENLLIDNINRISISEILCKFDEYLIKIVILKLKKLFYYTI